MHQFEGKKSRIKAFNHYILILWNITAFRGNHFLAEIGFHQKERYLAPMFHPIYLPLPAALTAPLQVKLFLSVYSLDTPFLHGMMKYGA